MNSKSHEYSKAEQGTNLDRLHASLLLDASVGVVKQISDTRARILYRSFGIKTVRDLLQLYPRRYIDMSCVVPIQQAEIGKSYTIFGTLYEIKQKRPKPRLTLVELSLLDESGLLIVTCFNQPWLAENLHKGERISVSGKIEFSYGFKRMVNPLIVAHEEGEAETGVVLPVHPSVAKIPRTTMRRMISNALSGIQGLYDPLPLSLRARYRLYSRYQAYRGVHNPVSISDANQARRRLRYEELFFLELELIDQEQKRIAGVKPFQHQIQGPYQDALRALLPFSLTQDQETAIAAISEKMSEDYPMNHLLLGDVGTGKTIVAAFALAACADTGTQALMMGPTEVLVQQYGATLGPLFDQMGVSWGILTGSTPSSQRNELLCELSEGRLQVLFGTHALLEKEVRVARCSLVCIDEQQRFGVEQRQALIDKAPGADFLSMTATPIPRSLALALYGGLSLSYLHAAPAKQGGRSTTVCHFSQEGIAYDALRAALERGEQAYVICPLIGLDLEDHETGQQEEEAGNQSIIEYAAIEWDIEHDEVGDTLSAATLHAKILQEQIVPGVRVGLLHGKMNSQEKAQIMEEFRQGSIQVLVSTTVVEVGVDVPNATVMIIEDADRFGLAQLHQLRGRVGRGNLSGLVFLVSRSKAPQSLERLRIMEKVDDGFELSEYDLSLRREGDIFGNRQHGRSRLALVNVIRDKAIIEAAYHDARACYRGQGLSQEEHRLIMNELKIVEKARG